MLLCTQDDKGFKQSKISGCEANIPGREVIWASEGKIKAGEDAIRAVQDSNTASSLN